MADKEMAAKAEKKSLNDIQIPNWIGFVIIGVAVVILLCIFLIGRYNAGKKANAALATPQTEITQADPNAVTMEVLPQTERNFDNSNAVNPFVAKDLSSLKLKGVVTNSTGRITAVVETDNASYILEVGDYLKGTQWKVNSIDENSIIFSNDTSTKAFYMDN